MSPEQNSHDPKTPETALSGRESLFDRRLREYRNTGSMAKPLRKSLQFIRKASADYEPSSLDSTQKQSSPDDEITEIERLAFYDESSGLLNARTIMSKIPTEMRRSARYKHSFSIFIIELDGFNLENSLTPLAADLIFSSFCKLLNKSIREVDKVGRFDKSTLLVVCPETNLRQATVEAERLRQVVAGTHLRQVGHHNPVTVSIGIASFPDHGNAPVDILGAAMAAAQQSVAYGGNTVCTASIDPLVSQRQQIQAQDFSPKAETADNKHTEQDMSPSVGNIGSEIAFPVAVDLSTIIP